MLLVCNMYVIFKMFPPIKINLQRVNFKPPALESAWARTCTPFRPDNLVQDWFNFH